VSGGAQVDKWSNWGVPAAPQNSPLNRVPQYFPVLEVQQNLAIGGILAADLGSMKADLGSMKVLTANLQSNSAIPLWQPNFGFDLIQASEPVNVYTYIARYLGSTPDYVSAYQTAYVSARTQGYVTTGTSQGYVTTGTSTQENVRMPAATIQSFYSSPTSAPPLSVVGLEFSNQRALMAFWSQSAVLPRQLREAIFKDFSQLIDAIREDPEPVEINLNSIQIALRFLGKAAPAVAPKLAVTEAGNLYLKWYDEKDGLVGITFKADGRAVWSSSKGDPKDPVTRMAEAGERHAEMLAGFLRDLAPWIFNERLANPGWRRAAA